MVIVFTAPSFLFPLQSKDRSTISAMAVSDDDSLLCAADHLGYIYIWNITNYALQGPEEEPPACEQHSLSSPFTHNAPSLYHIADRCITDLYLLGFFPHLFIKCFKVGELIAAVLQGKINFVNSRPSVLYLLKRCHLLFYPYMYLKIIVFHREYKTKLLTI